MKRRHLQRTMIFWRGKRKFKLIMASTGDKFGRKRSECVWFICCYFRFFQNYLFILNLLFVCFGFSLINFYLFIFRKTGSKYIYFECNRNDYGYKIKDDDVRQRHPKYGKTLQCKEKCPAHMHVKMSGCGSVTVHSYSLEHSGHDVDLRNKKIDDETRAEIGAMISDERSVDYVVKKLRG